jgi:hypothetical protein
LRSRHRPAFERVHERLADSSNAPDLTHLKSRSTIGASLLIP